MIPVVIVTISDIDRTPIYPTTEFNLEKLTRISSFDLENGIELPKMPNGVGDRWLSNGSIERNVGVVVFDGSENWHMSDEQINTVRFGSIVGTPYINLSQNNGISTHFPLVGTTYMVDVEGFQGTSSGEIIFRILKSRLSGYQEDWTNNQKINAFKQWLAEQKDADNPLTVYYLLTEPIIETAPILPEYIDFYDGGSVIVDDGVIDYSVVGNQAQINYIEGNITTVTDGQFEISKPTKIISKSNDLYDYDISTLPNYLEYGTLSQDTYNNTLEFIDNNQNKQIKLFFNENIQESRYNIYLENDTVIINNATEVIRIYNDNTYTSTRNLDTDITYKLEGYHILEYIDGKFDNTVLAFFWVIPALLVGGLIYLALKRKE